MSTVGIAVRNSFNGSKNQIPKILVVEDERIVALDLTNTLRRLGYEVQESVASGEEAVDAARRVQPHLVLMDIRLSGEMDGIAAAEFIARDTGAPVIFLTAHSDSNTLERVRSSNPYGYLLKPFRADDLRCAVEVTLHRHALDKELQEREKWLRTTLNSIHDGVITTDDIGHIRFLNPVATKMTGWSPEAAAGHVFDEVVRLCDQTQKTIAKLEDGVPKGLELVVWSKNGEQRDVEPASASIRDERGQIIGRVVALRDVTERRAALNEIRRLSEGLEETVLKRTLELQTANRELDAFSYSLAHDLRSPLRAIDGYVQAVIDTLGHSASAEVVEMLRRVRTTAQRTSRLIVDLLHLAHLSKADAHFEHIDVSAMAAELGSELAVQSTHNVLLAVQPNMYVMADRALLHATLANLMSNAWKFTSATPAPRVEVAATKSNHDHVFFVRDNGVGFDMTSAEDIFAPFKRLHGAQYVGDGIGLAVVDRAVRRMRGRVWAESAPNKGTTMFFTLGTEESVRN